MPSLSKLIALPAALFVAACLAVGPVVAQKGPALEATVSRSTNQPALDPTLAPGNLFDPEITRSLILAPKSDNGWYKVPTWYVGKWETFQSVETFFRYEQSGHEYRRNLVTNSHNVDTSGFFADKTGQVWENGPPGQRSDYEHDTSFCYCFLISRTNPVGTDKEFDYHDQAVSFYVDKNTKKIKSCTRIAGETSVYPISPNAIRRRSIVRTFDWQGNPTTTEESICNFKQIGEFAEDPNRTNPDGKPLYPLFIQFLKDNGMADRIPDAPPVAPNTVAKP